MKAALRLLAHAPLFALLFLFALLDYLFRWQYPVYGQKRISYDYPHGTGTGH